MSKSERKSKVYVIPNNHIDREWTYDAQMTRMLTVKFFDDLIETYEKIPDFQFVLDSQTVPLEDYLELFPEKRELLKKYVEEKRLWVGPWYSAPDCFYLNGESIVRNLLIGHRVAQAFGNVSKFGYTPFGWGQVSQLPQIYEGFGIDSIFFYRGADNVETNYYTWVGADGTKANCIKYPRTNFWEKVFRPVTKNRDTVPWDRELDYVSNEVPFMFSGDEFKYEHGFLADGKFKMKESTGIKEAIDRFVEEEAGNFPGDMILGMNGMDTCFPPLIGLLAIDKVKNEKNEEYELAYSSLDRFSKELKDVVQTGNIEMEEHKGEMRRFLPGFGGKAKSELKTTHFYIAAVRPLQKSKNAKAENLLTRCAEPFAAISHVLGKPYPEEYLTAAWKNLLKCHPHDTIAGCGADQIELDMLNRLDQTINISKAVLNASLQHIVTNIDNSDIKDYEIPLVIFNQSPVTRKEILSLWLHIPEKMSFEEFEIIEKQSKKKLNFEIATRGEMEDRIFRDLTDTSLYVYGELVKIEVEVEVDGMGYKTLLVRKADGNPASPSTLVTAENQMENEYIKVTILADGTLDIQNKETGKEFKNLHYFTDTGDVGNPWVRIVPDLSHVYSSRGMEAKIKLVESSSLITRYEVVYPMMIPVGLVKGNYSVKGGYFEEAESSSELVPLHIKSIITLTKTSQYVDIQTEIDNQSADHLVRVNFPSMLNTDKVYAESGFDVVERTIKKNRENIDPSLVNGEDPFIRFVDISDNTDGLAVISDSIKGYEVLGDEDNTLALNLIRAHTSQIVTIYGRKERRPDFVLTQAQGIQKFHYAIYPHAGNWENGCLTQAEQVNYPMIPTQTHRSFGKLPCEQSFIRTDSDKLVLSALKKADREDDLIIRVYNPSNAKAEVCLELFKEIRKAEEVNLNEEPINSEMPVVWEGKHLKINAGAKKIITCKVAL